jgi:hypothetical protein
VVHRERLVDDTPHVHVSLADVELPNHVRFTQYVFRMRSCAMTVVLDDAGERVLLMRRHRFIVDRWVSRSLRAERSAASPTGCPRALVRALLVVSEVPVGAHRVGCAAAAGDLVLHFAGRRYGRSSVLLWSWRIWAQ